MKRQHILCKKRYKNRREIFEKKPIKWAKLVYKKALILNIFPS